MTIARLSAVHPVSGQVTRVEAIFNELTTMAAKAPGYIWGSGIILRKAMGRWEGSPYGAAMKTSTM